MKIVWMLLGAVALGVTAFAGYWAWPMIFPQVIAVAPLMTSCDLQQGPCTGNLPGGGMVHFEIEPRPIATLHPLNLTVRIEGLAVHAVEVDFAGTDMNMGFNRVQLENLGSNQWQGKVTLPTCVRTRMKWEARVFLSTDQGLMAAPFRFESLSVAG